MKRAARVLMAAGLVVAATSPATADVFEIGGDGSVHTRASAGAVVWSGDDGATGAMFDATDASLADVPVGALTTLDAPEAPDQYRAALGQAARRYDVSPSLLAALVWHESRWQPAALSTKGAIGLGQLMPATARALAVDPRDAGANLAGAAHYLRQMLDLFDGDVERALAAYNAGPARVLKANGVPRIAETRTYVSSIIERLARPGASSNPGDNR